MGEKKKYAQELVRSGERERESGNFDGAEVVLRLAQHIYEELGDYRALAHVWGHLGLNSQLWGRYSEATERFSQSFLCAIKAGDREAVAVALRHVGKLWTMADVSDRSLGISLLRASVQMSPGSRAHRTWFRHGLSGAYLADGQRLKAVWQGVLSLGDLALGWRKEPDQLKKRAWLTGALLDLGKLPVVGGVFNRRALSLAASWDLEFRRQQALRALGRDS